MEQLWSLYNKDEKLRIDDLKSEHVRIILLAIPTARMKEWYACRQGDMAWQPISEVPDFYEDVRVLKGTASTGSEEKSREFDEDDFRQRGMAALVANGESEPENKTDKVLKKREKPMAPPRMAAPPKDISKPVFRPEPKLGATKASVRERRSARRYPRQLKFRVSQSEKVFECETRDISMSGLALTTTLPIWLPKTFRASLSHKETLVRVLCSRVAESKLQILEAESWDVIRQWIVNW